MTSTRAPRRSPRPETALLPRVALAAALAAFAACMLAAGASATRDLTVTLDVPASSTDNATFAVNMTAFNAGSGAGTSVQVQLYVDGNATATLHDLGNLANGQNASAVENLTLACGVHQLNATVDPNDGIPESNESNNNASATFSVVPFVNFTSSISGDPGSITLALDGSASHGCAPLTYNWVIDGLPRTGAQVNFTPNAGNINVTLMVMSQANPLLVNSLTRTVAIPNGAPTVAATVPSATIATLTPLALAVTADDADGYVADYFVDFGDGNNTTDLGTAIAYRYHASGNFTVRVVVTDNLGAANETTLSVRVTNRAPDAVTYPPQAWEAAEGTPVEFNASQSRDPEGGALVYLWDFGDGSTGTGAVVNHTYVRAGRYTATLTVTDSAGASANSTIAVLIDPGPSTGSLLPIIGGVIVLAALGLLLLMRRRRRDEDEEKPDEHEAQAKGAATDPARAGEGSSLKPPSP